ncbi:MAG: [FeFe] hydrogenase H-cluster maturation GTPase HydF, partial [Planctomycetes bacterium]|nr:[FeFe] hydrogenase H-cluster maturation GTPase HydF [Planctomycetota bacterium]
MAFSSMKPHIGIFGRRNVGKSSLINAITGQDISIVSSHAGTTTDPVKKAYEIGGIGPVIFIDTAGIDDIGDLGKKRIDSTKKTIRNINLGVIIITNNDISEFDLQIVDYLTKQKAPYIFVHNKSDVSSISKEIREKIHNKFSADVIDFCSINPTETQMYDIVDAIRKNLPSSAYNNPTILGDFVSYGDVVLLVTPIDIQAPKGRLILPQMQTIRDALDNDCIVMMSKEREVDIVFNKLKIKPKLVVCDSQAFLKVDASVPKNISLTSFSILFARLKGDFDKFVAGTSHISKLNNNDNILIMESCSHHIQGDDIARVKIPRWITNFTGKKLNFDVIA